MRFDQKIQLVTEGEKVFDPSTGNNITAEPTYIGVWANVTDMTEDTQAFLFGGLKQGAKTIRLQGHVMRRFDYVQIGDTKYNVRSQRVLRRFTVLKVSERQ